jgi:hypothetical protein
MFGRVIRYLSFAAIRSKKVVGDSASSAMSVQMFGVVAVVGKRRD